MLDIWGRPAGYGTVSNTIVNYVKKTGARLTGTIDMSGNNIDGLPVIATELNGNDSACSYGIATSLVNQVNTSAVQKSGDTMTGNLVMSGSNITGLPVDLFGLAGNSSACSYKIVLDFITAEDLIVVHKSGDTMTGDLILSVGTDNLRGLRCTDL